MPGLWQQVRRLAGVSTPKPVIIVSGLPRSGTSLMMGMLAAGGVPVITDAQRQADEDNPQGYYEFERVKRLKKGDIGWLAGAQGHAVKVISALLPHLPPGYSYQVLFMERPLAEVLASQRKMLARRRPDQVEAGEEDEIAALLSRHLEETRRWLAAQPHIATLYIPYHGLVADPPRYIQQIGQFLALPLDRQAMAAAVEPTLYRNRLNR